MSLIDDQTSATDSFQYSEKYVTRAEYDDLKTRFDTLEQTVQTLLRTSQAPPQGSYYIPMGNQGMGAGGASNVVPSYNPPPHPPQQQGPMGGYQMMPAGYIPAPQQPQRYAGPESPRTVQSPRHMQPPSAGGTMQHQQSPTTSPVLQHPHSGGGVTSPIHSANPKSPQSANPKNSPLSLASITTPYTEHQSKNYHAQALMSLGERLRLAILAREDPVDHILGVPLWRRQPRAHKTLWSGDQVMIPPCPSKCNNSNLEDIIGDMAMRQLWYPCHRGGISRMKGSGWATVLGTDEVEDGIVVSVLIIVAVGGVFGYFTLFSMVQSLIPAFFER